MTEERLSQQCATCGGELQVIPMDDGAVGLCKCGGVWLDNRISEQIVSGNLVEATRDRLHALFNAAKEPEQKAINYRAPDRSMEGARLCITCSQPLRSIVTDPALHGVTIQLDVCADHGIWFDPREAWTLLQVIELKKLENELVHSGRR